MRSFYVHVCRFLCRKLWVQVHYAIEMQKGLMREKGIRHNIKTRSTSHKLHTVDTTTAWTQDSSGVPTCGQPIAEEIVEMMKSSEFQTHLRQEITRQDAELGRQCAGIRVASVRAATQTETNKTNNNNKKRNS